MGRKALPTHLKVLAGNPGKQRLPKGEPEPPPGMPDPPSQLKGYALGEWDRIAQGLNNMGVLSYWDRECLGAYCVAYSRWRHAEEELQKLEYKNGVLAALVLQTKQGNWIQQPLIGIANKAAGDMVRFAAEFGMTPSARSRLAIDPGRGRKSKFDGLLNGGKSK